MTRYSLFVLIMPLNTKRQQTIWWYSASACLDADDSRFWQNTEIHSCFIGYHIVRSF